MANPTPKRLQVFVSSTYEDLKPERQAAVEAILQAGHIPAGMELFAAGDQSQMEVIRRWIDDSDVFLLILGGRYGSIEVESGKSYTHLEFDHAVATGKPRFSCVISEGAVKRRAEKEGGTKLIELENPAMLKDFRAEVGKSMVEIWEDVKDIKLGIHKALSEIERREGLGGWVRADASFNAPEVANELARLSRENSELRERAGHVEYCGLSYEDLATLLREDNLDALLLQIRNFLTTHPNENLGWIADASKAHRSRSRSEVFRECMRLVNMGLIELQTVMKSAGPREVVRLSEDCKRFLNKFDLLLKADAALP